MPNNRQHRAARGFSAILIACLAATTVAGSAAALPADGDKAEQRAERQLEREGRKAEREERKAEWEAARSELKAELEERKVERAELLHERKAALEERKVEAKILREETRAAVSDLREGFAEMTVEERTAVLDQARTLRQQLQLSFHELMGAWRTERDNLLPQAESPDDATEVEADSETA